jgi:hypothetical protein
MNKAIIEDFRLVNFGNWRAQADVRLPSDIIVKNCKVVQETGKTAWFSLPQISFPSRDSNKNIYLTVIALPPELLRDVSSLVLERYRREVGHD